VSEKTKNMTYAEAVVAIVVDGKDVSCQGGDAIYLDYNTFRFRKNGQPAIPGLFGKDSAYWRVVEAEPEPLPVVDFVEARAAKQKQGGEGDE
jgi:hypothetical protein